MEMQSIRAALIESMEEFLNIVYPIKPNEEIDVQTFERIFLYFFTCCRDLVKFLKYFFTFYRIYLKKDWIF